MLRVSVVTSVLNRSSSIGDTVLSVQRQSYRNVEHIIQDGGSDDGTLEVIARMMRGGMSLVSENDSGIYDGLNKGILRTTGDIVGLLHSDDIFADENVLSRIAERLADPALDGVYGDLVYLAADNSSRIVRSWRAGEYSFDRLRWGWMPPHPTLFLKRHVYEQLGLFDTTFRVAADYEAILRYLVKGGVRLGYLPEVLVKMRLGGASNGSLSAVLIKSKEDYRALRRHEVGGFVSLVAKNVRKVCQFF